MKYQLLVKTGSRWTRICEVNARSQRAAFRLCVVRLKVEHYDKPIQIRKMEKPKSR